jgi:hypothetical protein
LTTRFDANDAIDAINDAIWRDLRRDLTQTTRSTRFTTRFDANDAIDKMFNSTVSVFKLEVKCHDRENLQSAILLV